MLPIKQKTKGQRSRRLGTHSCFRTQEDTFRADFLLELLGVAALVGVKFLFSSSALRNTVDVTETKQDRPRPNEAE